MARCTVTKGQRQLGRNIRKLENSIELSSNECRAKMAEQKYKQKTQATQEFTSDSPVQNLRDASKWKKDEVKT
jgi:hypothetical protein